MPLDHFVSQVHLRNFYAPTLNEKKMYATRKSDLESFPCGSEDVCRIMDGNTNPYLTEERAIEEFLKFIEPKYNASLEKIRSKSIDQEAIYVIAGFVSYIATCSPTAGRLQAIGIAETVKISALILDQQGEMPKPPTALGDGSFSDLLLDGTINAKIDEQYPQAIGISIVLKLINTFGNSMWEVMINGDENNPFLTSDYPIAIEETSDPRFVRKIIPLAPDMAIRIIPDINLNRDELSDKFKHLRLRYVRVNRKKVAHINRLIVRSAEDVIFSSHNAPWVNNLVKRNRNFALTTLIDRIAVDEGYMILARQRVQDKAGLVKSQNIDT